MDIKSLKAVIIPAKFMEGVNSTKFNLYNYIRLVLTELGVLTPSPAPVKYLIGVITQNGTSNPVIADTVNTIAAYSATRIGTGSYAITFTENPGTTKFMVIVEETLTHATKNIFGQYSSENNRIEIYCRDSATGASVDISNSAYFEIKAFM